MTTNIPIRRRLILHDEDYRYPVIAFTDKAEYGHASTYLDVAKNRLHIDEFEVAPEARRRGIGRALLTAVRDLAHDIEVDEVSARITSRECLDVMNTVYGQSAVYVRRQGTYATSTDKPAVSTSASLRYFPVEHTL